MILRTLWAYLNGVIATAVLSAAVVITSLLRHRGNFYHHLSTLWSRWILWASGARVIIEGMHNLRGDRPKIVASNHQSWYDVWALAGNLPPRYRFVAKKELQSIPLFGLAWVSAGHVSINREDRTKAINALDEAAELVRSDNSTIVIFPEGTRSETGELQPFKKGAFALAARTGIEIVPVAVVGSRRILKKGDWRVRSGTIIVRFGEPIDSSKFGEENRDELMEVTRERIADLLGTNEVSTSPTPAR